MRTNPTRHSPVVILVHVSFIAYLISYAVPALKMGEHTAFGTMAALMSVAGMVEVFSDLPKPEALACLFGFFANLTLIAGYGVFNLRRSLNSRYWPALLMTLAAIAAGVTWMYLGRTSGRIIPYPGFYLWLFAIAVMALASWIVATSERGTGAVDVSAEAPLSHPSTSASN